MLIKYNGFIFKLTNTIDKDIESFSEEERNAFRWYVVQYLYKYICAKHRTEQNIHEFSKLSATEKDNILTDAYMTLFVNREKHTGTIAKCKEVLNT